MESTTFRARILNYNLLAYKATMYFESQTDSGRWVKFSCITMSLFIVMYIHFSCNVKKWLSLNTISLNIFDRVPMNISTVFDNAVEKSHKDSDFRWTCEIKNIIMSSFKSSRDIQKKEGGPDSCFG